MVKALRGETRHVIPFPSVVLKWTIGLLEYGCYGHRRERRTDVRTGSTRCRPGKNSVLFLDTFNVSILLVIAAGRAMRRRCGLPS